MKNTGRSAGATVVQLYMISRGGTAKQRLVGFERVELAPGEEKMVTMAIDPRLLADWNGGGWTTPADQYRFALGDNAESLSTPVSVTMAARSWKD